MKFVHSIIQTLSRESLVNIIYSCTITAVITVAIILLFIGYSYWEEHSEKKHHTMVYGVKETAVTIQHEKLNTDDEEFLRHVRAFQACEQSKACKFGEVFDNFMAFLHLHDHPNYEDMRLVQYVLRKYDLHSAYQWITVAQAFWMLNPWEVMIPYIPVEWSISEEEEEEEITTEEEVIGAESAASASPVQA